MTRSREFIPCYDDPLWRDRYDYANRVGDMRMVEMMRDQAGRESDIVKQIRQLEIESYQKAKASFYGDFTSRPPWLRSDFMEPVTAPEPKKSKPKPRKKTMNYSSAVMLFNDKIRAISVTYEPDTATKKQDRFTYKSLDQSIKVGDFVVVPTGTRHNFTVCLVDAVDVDVDYDADFEFKWIVGKADVAGYEGIIAEEKKWIDAMKSSEKLAKKNKIKKNFEDFLNTEGAIPVPALSGPVAPKAETDKPIEG